MRVLFFFLGHVVRRPVFRLSPTSRRRLSHLLLAGALTGLAACGSARPPAERGEALLFSPNGEPLSGGPLGRPKCGPAIAGWFARVDADHDGGITLDKFLADAHAQFARMDIRHAGYVTAADLSEFRAPYESGPGGPPGGGEARRDNDGGPDGGPNGGPNGGLGGDGPRGGGPGGGRGPGGRTAARGPLVDTRADPVMSADKSLSFKVTEADFIQHGREVFAELNSTHDGRLTLLQAQVDCKDGDKDKGR